MPTINFVDHTGKLYLVEAPIGQSAMQAATNAGVPGVLADCGGACSCATCHGYVDDAWMGRVPPAESAEKEMLECALDVNENSRLTCQIRITPELDGLVIRLPKSQL
jgi:2Fe-2S ferredoxin